MGEPTNGREPAPSAAAGGEASTPAAPLGDEIDRTIAEFFPVSEPVRDDYRPRRRKT